MIVKKNSERPKILSQCRSQRSTPRVDNCSDERHFRSLSTGGVEKFKKETLQEYLEGGTSRAI